jgi:hypothetical protein
MDQETLISRLRKVVPCGRTLGHGESCSEGYLCEACDLLIKAADEIERLQRVAGAVTTGESFGEMRERSKRS